MEIKSPALKSIDSSLTLYNNSLQKSLAVTDFIKKTPKLFSRYNSLGSGDRERETELEEVMTGVLKDKEREILERFES